MGFTKKVIVALSMCSSISAFADGIEWSGFGSLYYSQAFDNHFVVGQNGNNKPNFTDQSLLGLNLGSKITDEMSVASQIVMAGSSAQTENFNLFAQWAYLTYKLQDTASVKIGRQLWPVLISSEYQRVHYLLPQSNIPYTAYGLLPFVSFDGASVNKTLDVGIGSLTLGAYLGNPKLNTTPPPALSLDFQTLSGVRATLDGSGWRLHASYNRVFSKVKIDTESYATATGTTVTRTTGKAEVSSDIMSFGYRFDKYNFVSWGEMVYNKASDDVNLTLTNSALGVIANKKLFEKSYGGYVLMGYRLGKFLPSVTWAQGTQFLGLPEDSSNTPLVSKYQGRTTAYIFGTSYQVNDQASLKFEYLNVKVPSIGGGWYDVAQSATSTKKSASAVKAGVDFIF
jgi:hypothetical protein